MPVAVNTQVGNSLYSKKRIRRIFVDYFESIGITVNGALVPMRNLDTPATLDNLLLPETDFFEFASITGWSPREEIVISQDVPMPMTLLAVNMEVEL